MEELWSEIRGFEAYEVSTYGRIIRSASGRFLQYYQNQYHVVNVGLMRGHAQFKRSVPLLVARAYVPKLAAHFAFNTPINIDGDRWNNRVDNLVWRSRRYAILYNQQFLNPYDNPITVPIVDIATGMEYPDSFSCAIANGLLEQDIVLAILNLTFTWPTYQIFEVV